MGYIYILYIIYIYYKTRIFPNSHGFKHHFPMNKLLFGTSSPFPDTHIPSWDPFFAHDYSWSMWLSLSDHPCWKGIWPSKCERKKLWHISEPRELWTTAVALENKKKNEITSCSIIFDGHECVASGEDLMHITLEKDLLAQQAMATNTPQTMGNSAINWDCGCTLWLIQPGTDHDWFSDGETLFKKSGC